MTITNFFVNPSFEVELITSGSNGASGHGGTGGVTRETGDGNATGDWCCEGSGGGAGTGMKYVQAHTATGAFSTSFDVWHVSGGTAWVAEVYTEAFALLGASAITAGAKQRITIALPAVGAHTSIGVYIYLNEASAGAIRVDAFYLGTEASDYFDGDTADGGGFLYAWTGTPHDSTSTRTEAPATGNSTLRRIRSQFQLRPY